MPLKTTQFDIQDHLKTLEQQIPYLEAALEEDDPSFIATAIGDIAKARGVSQFFARNWLKPRSDLQIIPARRQSDY
ncbi:putative addiction module antidote protein [Bradyrhizobium sp. i1.8.4]|uniref:helix-turn-helix domain-containing transcriptional regulator n=1 Tax=unclassified Bradyrhizobium TaxID=2631580 RepID=UPI003D1ACAE1